MPWDLRPDVATQRQVEALRHRNDVSVDLEARGRSVSPHSVRLPDSPHGKHREYADARNSNSPTRRSITWEDQVAPARRRAASPPRLATPDRAARQRAADAVQRAREPRAAKAAGARQGGITRPTKATLAQQRERPAVSVDHRWNPSTHQESKLQLKQQAEGQGEAQEYDENGRPVRRRRRRRPRPETAPGSEDTQTMAERFLAGGGDDGSTDRSLMLAVEETQRRLTSVLDAIDVRASGHFDPSPSAPSHTLAEAERWAMRELQRTGPLTPSRVSRPVSPPPPPPPPPAAPAAAPAAVPGSPAVSSDAVVGEVARVERELNSRAQALQADMARLAEKKEVLRRQLYREEVEADCARRLQAITGQLQSQLEAQLQALQQDQGKRLEDYASFAADVDAKVQALLAMKAEAKAKAQHMALEFEAGARELHESYAGLVSEARRKLEGELQEALRAFS